MFYILFIGLYPDLEKLAKDGNVPKLFYKPLNIFAIAVLSYAISAIVHAFIDIIDNYTG
jgi:hypothetical protein